MHEACEFAVIYQWDVAIENREEFISLWAALTASIRESRGGLGSRIHQKVNGTYVAYAQWPNRATWETASKLPSPLPEISKRIQEIVLKRYEPMPLEVMRDLLSESK